jgi:hypothetical protein
MRLKQSASLSLALDLPQVVLTDVAVHRNFGAVPTLTALDWTYFVFFVYFWHFSNLNSLKDSCWSITGWFCPFPAFLLVFGFFQSLLELLHLTVELKIGVVQILYHQAQSQRVLEEGGSVEREEGGEGALFSSLLILEVRKHSVV